MNLNRNNIKKILFIITFTLVLAMCLFNISTTVGYIKLTLSVAAPFLIGGAIAFVVNIPMNIFENKIFKNKYLINKKIANKLSRPISLVLALIFILGIVMIVIGVVVPDLYKTISSVSNNIKSFLPKLYDFVRNNINNDTIQNYIYELQKMDWLGMLNDYMKIFTTGAGSVISTTMNMISSVMNTTVNIAIAIVFCIYILLQKEVLGDNFRKILKAFLNKEHYDNVIRIIALTQKTFTNYVTGQCLDAFILGVMFFIVLLVTGMPYALLIGVLIGFTALIPLVGAFIGCVISMFLLFMVSPAKSLIFLVIFIILQQLEENLIYPKVVGSSVGLPSIWVLVAVTIGASLWGVIGMIVFIPLFSVIYSLFREYIYKRIAQKEE